MSISAISPVGASAISPAAESAYLVNTYGAVLAATGNPAVTVVPIQPRPPEVPRVAAVGGVLGARIDTYA
jgi:hypothetical protein